MNKIVKIVGTIPFIAWVVIGLLMSAACVCQLLIKGFTLGREGTFFQTVNLPEIAVVAVLIFVAYKYPSKHTLLGGLLCLALLLCYLGGYGFLEFTLKQIGWNSDWRMYLVAIVTLWGAVGVSLYALAIAPPPKPKNC